jgi:hypothetical protein
MQCTHVVLPYSMHNAYIRSQTLHSFASKALARMPSFVFVSVFVSVFVYVYVS